MFLKVGRFWFYYVSEADVAENSSCDLIRFLYHQLRSEVSKMFYIF